jgi:hypothetical protein
LNVNSNLKNADAISDQIQKSLIANNKNSDLINNFISNEVISPTQKGLTAKRNKSQVSETSVTLVAIYPLPGRK